MSITIKCRCGRALRTKDEFAGRRARCPGCGALLVIPKPTTETSLPVLEQSAEPLETEAGAPNRSAASSADVPRTRGGKRRVVLWTLGSTVLLTSVVLIVIGVLRWTSQRGTVELVEWRITQSIRTGPLPLSWASPEEGHCFFVVRLCMSPSLLISIEDQQIRSSLRDFRLTVNGRTTGASAAREIFVFSGREDPLANLPWENFYKGLPLQVFPEPGGDFDLNTPVPVTLLWEVEGDAGSFDHTGGNAYVQFKDHPPMVLDTDLEKQP